MLVGFLVLAKLTTEAIRLAFRLEPNHEFIDAFRLPVAPTHDRRHAHAHAQAQRQDPDSLHPRRAQARRLPQAIARYCHRGRPPGLVDTGTSPPTINSTLSGLKFFFDVTLGHAELMVKVQPVHQPRPLPVVLSCDEVARLIAAAPNPKYQAALSVAYGTGLRVSEVCALKVSDIDSERMTLRVEQGKGRKDRYAMLSPVLLERLRAWWRVGHAQGKMLPNGWLFPGLNPMDSLSTRQLNRAIHLAADAAHIDKRVSMHTLRHYLPFLTMSCTGLMASCGAALSTTRAT